MTGQDRSRLGEACISMYIAGQKKVFGKLGSVIFSGGAIYHLHTAIGVSS